MSDYPSYLLEPSPPSPSAPSPPPPSPSAPAPTPALKKRGWFRRNLWGMLAILPVTIGLLVVYIDRANGFERFWTHEPRVPVNAATGAWLDYGGAKMRIVEFGVAKDVVDISRKPFVAPQGLQIWRAVVEYDVADPKTNPLIGCKLSLEDDRGRLYGIGASELSTAKLPLPGCTAEDDKLNRYQTFVFFVTPSDATPVALRMSVFTALPRYARITVQP